jgi:hypothetical protein
MSKGVVHRPDCPSIRNAKVARWRWADTYPDVDGVAKYPWAAAMRCQRCMPPSPLASKETGGATAELLGRWRDRHIAGRFFTAEAVTADGYMVQGKAIDPDWFDGQPHPWSVRAELLPVNYERADTPASEGIEK